MKRISGSSIQCAFNVSLLLIASKTHARIIYVDSRAPGPGTGSSWTNAHKYLQDALADANSGQRPLEIRVAQGIYKPDRGAGITSGDREATFQLINGVTLKGGYAGFGEADPNARDTAKYETILSGDLAGNDIEVKDPRDLLNEPTRAENIYHVVTALGTGNKTILDGFTITGGHANESSAFPSPYEAGGGMYNESGSPILTNCTFRGNSANHGGAIYNHQGSLLISHTLFDGNFTFTVCWGDVCSPGTGSGIYNDSSNTKVENSAFTHNSGTDGRGGGIFNSQGRHELTNCTFIGNSAHAGGGAIYNSCVSNIALTNCLFTGNSSLEGGAVANELSNTSIIACTFGLNLGAIGSGISNKRSTSKIIDCTFNGNLAESVAGGIYNNQTDATIMNCTFTGNRARGWYGGAIQNERCTPTFTNCTIAGNRAGRTGGGMCNRLGGNAILINCILWDNMAPNGPQIALKETYTGAEPSTITVCYSAVMGSREDVYVGLGCGLKWADGNIDTNPRFAEPGSWDPNGTPGDPNDDFWRNGDYHLKSQAGRWDANEGRWTKDDVTSPCIDAGDPNSDWTAELWPHGKRINMGAYGGTPQASMSSSVAGNVADFDADDVVDLKDLLALADVWLAEEVLLAQDTNRDGYVDFPDFATLAEQWRTGPGSWQEPFEIILGPKAKWSDLHKGYDPNLPGYHIVGDIAYVTIRAKIQNTPDKLVLAIKTSPGMPPMLENFTFTMGDIMMFSGEPFKGSGLTAFARDNSSSPWQDMGKIQIDYYFHFAIAGDEVRVTILPPAIMLLSTWCTVSWIDWYR